MKAPRQIGWLLQRLRYLVRPVLGVCAGLGAGLLLTLVAGENPLNVLLVLARSGFGSAYDFGMTLFYSTPLIFTGLSVGFAFRAGLFNIGAEGQLVVGAMAATAVGVLFPGISAPLAPVLAALAAFVGGAFWGGIAGWLRARRGSHEVITTIMLNFIASALTSWMTLNLLLNPETQNPESLPVAQGYLLAPLAPFGGAPVSWALLLALVTAFAVGVMLDRTVFGFELRTTGESETAARAAGIDSERMRFWALALAGGLAGLVGVAEVLGNSGRFRIEFSPGYGFTGIAVALLARGRPLAIVFSALLFGALHKGASDLDIETERVTRELSMILQALVILSVSAEGLWGRWERKAQPGGAR